MFSEIEGAGREGKKEKEFTRKQEEDEEKKSKKEEENAEVDMKEEGVDGLSKDLSSTS